MRIVSVLPSATEVVCALGAGEDLVGRSAECDYPREVTALPVVMGARTLDHDRPSAEIDARVRRARRAGESLYTLDVQLLRELRPDVLLTQDLCGVCSVTGEEVESACRASGVRPNVVSLSPRTLDEVWSSVETVGRTIGRATEGTRLAAELRRRAGRGPTSARRRVAVVEWLDPPILAGLWTPTMIEAGGGIPVGPSPGEPGAPTSWPALANMGVDLLVLSPCSFTVARTSRELGRPQLANAVRSVTEARDVWVVDEAYFSRPGPRLAEGVELLRSLLQDRLGPFPFPAVRLETAIGSVVA